MTHACVCHDSCMCVPWLMHVCAMTHTYVCMTYSYVTKRIHMWNDPFIRDMTHENVWHDSCMHVTWLTCTCAMTHVYMCHDARTCVPWLIHMWRDVSARETTHSHVTWLNLFRSHMTQPIYMWHDSTLSYVTWLNLFRSHMTQPIYMCHDSTQLFHI